jgi:hypothetical protein
MRAGSRDIDQRPHPAASSAKMNQQLTKALLLAANCRQRRRGKNPHGHPKTVMTAAQGIGRRLKPCGVRA